MLKNILIKKRRGLASLLIVFLVAMFSILIITSWQSRIFLSIHRAVALTDTMSATYHAESEINDVIARILGEYPLPSPGTRTLADGTVLTLVRTVSGNTEIIDVHAKRQFASTKIQVSKTTTEEESTNYDKVEIVLAADCTGSMNDKANPSCTGSCPNRITKEKEAILNFIDGIRDLPSEDREKYYLGILTFKIGKKWITYSGNEMQPTQDLSSLQSAVETGFGSNVGGSSACNISNPAVPGSGGETNLGTPTVFAADYLAPLAETRKKQIYILITDGLPNSSLADARCGTINCRSTDGGSCNTSALAYLQCGIADTNTTWGGSRLGLRDPNVDAYAVTLLSSPTSPGQQTAYNGTVAIFQNSDYVKEYYNSDNADNLSSFLDDIFNNILESTTTLSIKRIVPTPVR